MTPHSHQRTTSGSSVPLRLDGVTVGTIAVKDVIA